MDLYQLHYAAFFAVCQHELRPVRSGYRLALVYDLIAQVWQINCSVLLFRPVERIDFASWSKDSVTNILIEPFWVLHGSALSLEGTSDIVKIIEFAPALNPLDSVIWSLPDEAGLRRILKISSGR